MGSGVGSGAAEASEAGAPPGAPHGGGPLDPQGHVTAYWDYQGPSYDAQPGHGLHHEAERRAWLRALRGLLPPAPADILDVGTGTGFLAWLLAELGHRVTGVDLAPGMLAVARAERAKGAEGPEGAGAAAPLPAGAPDFRVGDAIDPPLPPASVDAVVNRHLLWTLTDPARAFASWRRLLRPGGRVVAIDGLWRLGQTPASAPPAAPGATPAAAEPSREVWGRHYTADVQQALPLYDAPSVDAAVAAARAAGFREVRVTALEEVDRTENESYPERPPRKPRYVLTAADGG
jgi:SAM-dependent methyltransferase